MKKLIKLALAVTMMVGLCFTSVSAATYTAKGTVFYPQSSTGDVDNTSITLELPVGTYSTAVTYEVGAHANLWEAGQISSTDDSKLPWYKLATFTLTSAEVSKLATSSIYVTVKPLFDYGVSNLQLAVGPYFQAYTGQSNISGGNNGGSTAGPGDLSAYSAMNMNVYQNSRVTKVKSTSTGFNVEGYMFEHYANCATPTALWREIVFVNTNTTSTSSAYRKQVTPINNPWLNSNMTATVNGKYNLRYANYSVSVNVNNMNDYVTNTPGKKMAAGTYYVYMRISNGKTSYLFPLKDVTLSDGTNMENTGKLPAGFTVYDKTTRALTYTVK